jgi:hypothetical protein
MDRFGGPFCLLASVDGDRKINPPEIESLGKILEAAICFYEIS